MTEQRTTRFVAFYTIVLGAAFAALSAAMSRYFGMGNRPWLARYFGVRDLILGGALSIRGIPGRCSWVAG